MSSKTVMQPGSVKARADVSLLEDNGPPSPGLDMHAVLGVPRPKRPSEKSEEGGMSEGADSDSTDPDSDGDDEEWQEGEYLVIEEDNEEMKELHTQMLSENASLSRELLVPTFTSCTQHYSKWMDAQKASLSGEEKSWRNKQLDIYRRILKLYGSDEEWEGMTHAQRVNRNKQALDASEEAKELGQPPVEVSNDLLGTSNKMAATDSVSGEITNKGLTESMANMNV